MNATGGMDEAATALGDSTVDEEWQPIEFDPHPSDFLPE